MAINRYAVAWERLKKHLEDAASKMPDSTPQKIIVLQTLFTMATLEPEEVPKPSSEERE